ncbi:MAG TPA: hypothetical protein VLC98_12680 [Phnomibacter sp.]|nr:hypothetical protein [Phnomibacter sp.]
MKVSLLMVITFLYSILPVAGQNIPIEKAKEHIGDSITVCSKVYGTKIITNPKGDTLTLINLGAAYPNQLLTVVIKPGNRKNFSYQPEEYLKTKNICVSGIVEQYKDAIQIEIKDEQHIAVTKN